MISFHLPYDSENAFRKVTAIAKEAKHHYHIIHTDKQSTVYGWVDGITKSDGRCDPGADCESCPFPCEKHNNKPSRK